MTLNVATTVVEAVDADDREPRSEGIDLAQEVLRGEPALAERVRRGVRGRGDAGIPDATRSESNRDISRVSPGSSSSNSSMQMRDAPFSNCTVGA